MSADLAVRGNSERLDSATGNYESLRNRLKDGLQEASDRMSVSGTFSAQAAQAMGASSVMDRVAKATEKSEKHLEKIATKNAEKEAAKTEATGEVDLSTELKQQTRYLRDIADKSGIAFA